MAAFIAPRALHEVNLSRGFCRCGRGRRTPIRPESDSSKGWVRGEPMLYVPGHAKRLQLGFYAVEDRGHRTPCWIWRGSLSTKGYAMRQDAPRLHRAMYEAKHGPIPAGTEPDHLCEQKACINPDHIDPVSHTENMRRCRHTKLTLELATEIRRQALEEGLSDSALAERFGVLRQTVRLIRLGQQWKDAA